MKRLTLFGRAVIAIIIVVLDSLLFAVPITAGVFAYILLFRPRWFFNFNKKLYKFTDKKKFSKNKISS